MCTVQHRNIIMLDEIVLESTARGEICDKVNSKVALDFFGAVANHLSDIDVFSHWLMGQYSELAEDCLKGILIK